MLLDVKQGDDQEKLYDAAHFIHVLHMMNSSNIPKHFKNKEHSLQRCIGLFYFTLYVSIKRRERNKKITVVKKNHVSLLQQKQMCSSSTCSEGVGRSAWSRETTGFRGSQSSCLQGSTPEWDSVI